MTVIELLSPWNKTGDGLRDYQEKQREVLLSDASLVEIDLLRRGQHAVAVPQALIRPSDYRICIHRAQRRRFELVRFGVRDPLPNVGIPLRSGEKTCPAPAAGLRPPLPGGAYAYKVSDAVEPDPPLALDYLALVDPSDFTEVPDDFTGEAVLAVAARVGATRLIDNLPLTFAALPPETPGAVS